MIPASWPDFRRLWAPLESNCSFFNKDFIKKSESEEDKSKYFYLCEEVGKQTSLEAADNALVAMKNWSGIKI